MTPQGERRPNRATNSRPRTEIKDPFVLEFLDLKDEYSEHDLEEALIGKLEDFLLELGGDFAMCRIEKSSGSATSGIGSTSCSSIDAYAVWW